MNIMHSELYSLYENEKNKKPCEIYLIMSLLHITITYAVIVTDTIYSLISM